MRLAHLADVHLGCRQYHRQTADGINQREADIARVFERALSDVIAAEPDLVIIAGDLFHSVRPTNTSILHAFEQLSRLRVGLPHAPVIIVAGNHDTPRSTETGTILKLFEALGGVTVVTSEVQEFPFEQFDSTVWCIPHAALASSPGIIPEPQSGTTHNVLVMHGEIAGVLSRDAAPLEYGGVVVEPHELHAERWDYVALGHYHVARSVLPNVWYSGSIDYVSTNPWGELTEEEVEGRRGRKGWLLVELGDMPSVEFRPVTLERRVLDLQPIQGKGMGAAELDKLIADRMESIEGGYENQIVRQVVLDVSRPVVHDLDHHRIREFKSKALHYNLDIRRPASSRVVGVGDPGRRQTLSDVLKSYLEKRSLPCDIDRNQLVELGLKYMDEVERDLLEE